MNNPKFPKGSLVLAESEIFEVIDFSPSEESYLYTLLLRAFYGKIWPTDLHNRDVLRQITLKEYKLEKFDHSKPKYNFGDRLKYLTDYKLFKHGLVRLICFEDGKYWYGLLHDETSYERNWLMYSDLIEEGYLTK